MSSYAIEGRRILRSDPGFAPLLESAYLDHRRPRCLCCVREPEMYVAKLGTRFAVKRMPGTGTLHAPDCPSYELPREMSGFAQAAQAAIREHRGTGQTWLKLDFSLSRRSPSLRASGGEVSEGRAVGKNRGMSLRALLHYLWDEAGLTRWQPEFAGRRSWSTVRRRLLAAAQGKQACGRRLEDVLYLPEPFYPEQSADIAARRALKWSAAIAAAPARSPFLLLLGEIKELTTTRLGHAVVIKQLPDRAFALGDDLYRRLIERFDQDLTLWGTSAAMHLITLAIFAVSHAGARIEELFLMPTNGQWIPVEDAWDAQLLERLHANRRVFAKCLRYDTGKQANLPSAVLLDTSDAPLPLTVGRDDIDARKGLQALPGTWVWRAGRSAIPPLPGQGPRYPVREPAAATDEPSGTGPMEISHAVGAPGTRRLARDQGSPLG